MKLYREGATGSSVGSCDHPIDNGVIDACSKCEKILRSRGFVSYRGQNQKAAVEVEAEVTLLTVEDEVEVSTKESEED